LGVPVHFHLALDKAALKKIIDHLGGIKLQVENDMNYEDPRQNLHIRIKRGSQHMDGETAVKYLRFRNDELGDVGRVLRQQQFLKALASQVFSLNGLAKWPGLEPLVLGTTDTNLTLPFFLRMVRSFSRYDKEAIRFEVLPGGAVTINGVSYWKTDSAELEKLLNKLGMR